MAIRNATVAALLVIAIGLYQLTPLKQICLQHCRSSTRSPARRHSRDQPPGAWAMARQGTRYGVSCLGCCSILMGLLFVGGLMNVLWMVLISLWVLAEKTLPGGNRLARVAGVGLVAWGSFSLVAGF
jgi:predicted metal-binding membrane protein